MMVMVMVVVKRMVMVMMMVRGRVTSAELRGNLGLNLSGGSSQPSLLPFHHHSRHLGAFYCFVF